MGLNLKKKILTGKIFLIFFIFVFSTIIGCSSAIGQRPARDPQVKSPHHISNRAEWKDTNGQYYLEIYATDHYNLGKLEGEYLESQILTLNQIIKELLIYYDIPLELVTSLAYIYNHYIPFIYKLEMFGISRAIPSLSYTDILLQIVFLDLFYGFLNPLMVSTDKLAGCTALSINQQGNMIGQNLDFSLLFYPTLSWVRYSLPRKTPVFALYMGAGTIPMGKNKYVSSLITLVQTKIFHQIFATPTFIKTKIAFENSKTADEFLNYLTDGFTCSWNFIIADKKKIIASETINSIRIDEVVKENNFAVRTNTYITEELEDYLIDPFYSKERQLKAEELVSYKLSMENPLSIIDIVEILSYYDGTNSSIIRFPNINDPLSTSTLSFFIFDLSSNNGYFGLGNTIISTLGIIPV